MFSFVAFTLLTMLHLLEVISRLSVLYSNIAPLYGIHNCILARHFMGMTDRLENVQRHFSRRVYYRCKLQSNHDYPDRLVHLKLESLELRRLYYKDMTMVYKIVHNLTSSNGDVLILYRNANHNYRISIRGHGFKLKNTAFRLYVARNHSCNRVVPY